ncbi:hypothetical protein AB1Y20_008536 [Prymnesium parvum]|uniref:Nuclear pore complex protein Nup85 n=1 Tax=Prymnesium parvum TaxID=97485 RepID=A0AB34IUU0_PRYPA
MRSSAILPSATGEHAADDDYYRVSELNSHASAFRAEDTFANRYRAFLATCDVLEWCSAHSLSDTARTAFDPGALEVGLDALASMVEVCDAACPPELIHDTWTALGHLGNAIRSGRDALFEDFSAKWDVHAKRLWHNAPVSCLHMYKHGILQLGAGDASIDQAIRDADTGCMERLFMHGALTGDVRGARLGGDALFGEMSALLAWHDVRERVVTSPLVQLDMNARQGQGVRRRGGGRGREN